MKFFCHRCGAMDSLEDDEIPAEGMSVPCAKCGTMIGLKPRAKSGASRPGSVSADRRSKSGASRPGGTLADKRSKSGASKPGAPASNPGPAPDRTVVEGQKRATIAEAETQIGGQTLSSIEQQAVSHEPTRADLPVAKSPSIEKPAPKPMDAVSALLQAKPEPSPSVIVSGGSEAFLASPASYYVGKGQGPFQQKHLLDAAVVPFHLRKLLVVGFGVFIGALLWVGIGTLFSLTESVVGARMGLVMGALIFWACATLASAVATFVTDQEMLQGKKMPLRIGFEFMISHPGRILGAPFVCILMALLFGIGVTVLSVLANVPVAGPLIYGIGWLGVLACSLGAVLTLGLMLATLFSHLPLVVHENIGPFSGVQAVVELVREDPKRYLIHFFVALGASLIFCVLAFRLMDVAFGLMGWVGAEVAPGVVSSVFGKVPVEIFGALLPLFPAGLVQMFAASPAAEEWQFGLSGWVVGLSLLLVMSHVLAAALIYFQSVGIINYHIIRESESADYT